MLFFSPRDVGDPCGMFTTAHIISLIICLVLIGLGIYLSRKVKDKNVFTIIKVISIMVTILEIIKIGYNFYYGYTYLDSWFPLAYCSLFIYATWMSGFGKGIICNIGNVFLVYGGIIAGLGFLIFPSTSLQIHPIFHYLSMYSMLFHSLMVYIGILLLVKNIVVINKNNYGIYILFCLFFMIISLIINKIYDCNMMFLKEPFNLPIDFLKNVQKKIPWLYSVIIMVVYFIGPPLGAYILSIFKTKEKKDV